MSYRNIRAGDSVTVHLSDGRREKATALGWSNEWGIAMLKITEKGPWPHVQLDKTAALRPGQLCVAVGYPMAPGNRYEQEPALRLGCVTKSAGSLWITSSCLLQLGDFGSGLFDLDARLVGVTTQMFGFNGGAIHTPTELVKAHWDDLAAGKNVDFIRCVASDKAAGVSVKSSGMPSQPKTDASSVAAATKKVIKATVKLQTPGGKGGHWSGVIVTSDGYIITCAHSNQVPGQKLVVSFADGRHAAGTALGTNRITDIAVVKITEKGPWPYVPMGDSFALKPLDPCLRTGYPGKAGFVLFSGWQPEVHRIKIADRPQNNVNKSAWSCFLATEAQSGNEMIPGESGGGVFDLQGRVVAVNQESQPPTFGIHGRVELFKNQWDLLIAGKPFDVIQGEPLADVADAFRRTAKRLPPFAVEVLSDGKQIALGTIVRSDGGILTKASELHGAISCRLADGRTLAATIQKVASQYDLAVLKVEATNLPVAEWGPSEELSVGSLVAAIIPGKSPRVGVVCHVARPIPADYGHLQVELHDSDRGLEIAGLAAGPIPTPIQSPFRKGDVIVHIEDHPTPNCQACRVLLEPASGKPIALAGDRVRIGVKRGKETLEIQAVLAPRDYQEFEFSPRNSGFASAFDIDIPLMPERALPFAPSSLCSGPIIDRVGVVVGVAIACRPQPLVLPASIVRKFLAE